MAVCRTCYQLPSKPRVLSVTPIRGGEITSGRQLFDFSDEIPCN